MSEHTTCKQRRLFYQRHSRGETYEAISRAMGVSRECVRYWCRRQRTGQGVQNQYQRKAPGILRRFAPKYLSKNKLINSDLVEWCSSMRETTYADVN